MARYVHGHDDGLPQTTRRRVRRRSSLQLRPSHSIPPLGDLSWPAWYLRMNTPSRGSRTCLPAHVCSADSEWPGLDAKLSSGPAWMNIGCVADRSTSEMSLQTPPIWPTQLSDDVSRPKGTKGRDAVVDKREQLRPPSIEMGSARSQDGIFDLLLVTPFLKCGESC